MLYFIEDHIHSVDSLEYVAPQIYTNIYMWLLHEVIAYFNMLPHVAKPATIMVHLVIEGCLFCIIF